jgi:hypothetical protein
MRAASIIAAVLACLCLAPAPAGADELKFGDAAPETAHRLVADKTALDTGGQGERCRRIEPGGALVFDLECDPEAQNYLTVKFWGSDGDVATLFLWVGGKRLGAYGEAWPELDLSQGGPAFPGRFYYATYTIPRLATAGKRTVTLKVAAVGSLAPYAASPSDREKPQTRPTRGIYRAYSGADPFFTPGSAETQGQAPPASFRPKPAGFPDVGQLRKDVDDAIARLMRWQLYGPAWEAAVAERRAPGIVRGAIARGASPSRAMSDPEWRDFVANPTTQNGLPLSALAIFAKAYQSPWSRHHHSAEILDRVVKGLDFYAALQGSNGAFCNKTWVGGPRRRPAAGSCLEGFGTQALGQAVLLLQNELAAGKLLEQPIDADGDPSTPALPRREAWAEMLRRHRDFLASKEGRGHAANQDLAQMNALWSANEVARVLAPPQAWPREKALEYVHSAAGLTKDPLGGYWITRKGLCLEPWGTLGGGYCGNYGLMGVHQLSDLARWTGDKKVEQRALDAVHAAAYFYYPAAGEDGYLCMKKEGIISTRNTKWPCATDYGIDAYAAGALRDPVAIRQVQLAIEHGVVPRVLPEGDSHFIEDLKPLVFGMENYEAALALAPAARRLPMEDGQADFAWADEQGATVAVKHRGARLYMSLNWRRGFKDGKRDPEHVQANNIARVHYTMPTIDRIATIEMESPHGFGKLYVCRYGPYLVAMNASEDAAYDVPLPAGVREAVDLVSGKACPAQGSVRVLPSTTAILYLGEAPV